MVWEPFSIFQPDMISLGPRHWWSKSSQVSSFKRQENWTKASWNEILEGLPKGSTFSKYKYLWKISQLQCHGEPATCSHCRNGLAKPGYRFPPLQITEPIQQPQSWVLVLQERKAREAPSLGLAISHQLCFPCQRVSLWLLPWHFCLLVSSAWSIYIQYLSPQQE